MLGRDKIIGVNPAAGSQVELLETMRMQGLTITAAIKTSMQLFGLDLKEAKLLVTTDPAWPPTARAAESFQRELAQSFRNMDDADPSLRLR